MCTEEAKKIGVAHMEGRQSWKGRYRKDGASPCVLDATERVEEVTWLARSL